MLFRIIGGATAAVVLVALSITASMPAHGAVFIVNSTANTGAGSLREAIEMANAADGNDTISFDPAVFAPGSPATIHLSSELPVIDATAGVAIDGTGAGVIIDGNSSFDALVFGPDDANLTDITVRNLSLSDFHSGVLIIARNVSNLTVESLSTEGVVNGIDVIGMDQMNHHLSDLEFAEGRLEYIVSSIDMLTLSAATITGSQSFGGVSFIYSSINGMTLNGVTSGSHDGAGFELIGGDVTNITIQSSSFDNNGSNGFFGATGNIQGLTVQDTTFNGNESAGWFLAADNVTSAQISGSSFSNNLDAGLDLIANFDGLIVDGSTASDNTRDGVSIIGTMNNTRLTGNIVHGNGAFGAFLVGDPSTGNEIMSNTFTDSGEDGVFIAGARFTVSQNSMSGNGELGIDLLPDGVNSEPSPGVTPNDPGDADEGGNDVLNFPENFGFPGSGLIGEACANCLIEVFEADGDPSDHGEGERYLGSAVADGAGDFAFEVCDLLAGAMVTATATDALGNTSEFSLNVTVPFDTPSCIPDNGDLDCDGEENGRDALIAIIHESGAEQVSRGVSCPELGSSLQQIASVVGPDIFGDVNCDGSVDAGDAVPILQFAAGLEADPPLPEGCVAVGQPFPD